MKEINFEEMKKIELDILIYVANFCNRHNLKYYLSYGTLIGAVRHKGFIPWDDDIDIIMPRADYNKLMDVFNKESINTPYVALIPGKSNHSFLKIGDGRTIKHEPEYSYDKVKGMIDIDIFPLDGVPENDSEYAKWYDKLNRIYSVYFYTKSNKKNYTTKFKLKFFIKRIMWGIFELKDYKLLNKAKKFHQKYPIETSNYVGVMESKWNSKKNKVKKEYYMDRIEVNFEGKKFYAPKGYHEILTNIYGDYMTLPPKEKQIREHSSQVFWVKDNTCI